MVFWSWFKHKREPDLITSQCLGTLLSLINGIKLSLHGSLALHQYKVLKSLIPLYSRRYSRDRSLLEHLSTTKRLRGCRSKGPLEQKLFLIWWVKRLPILEQRHYCYSPQQNLGLGKTHRTVKAKAKINRLRVYLGRLRWIHEQSPKSRLNTFEIVL